MQNIPVGTLCIIVNGTGDIYDEFNGRECTVLEGVAPHGATDKRGVKGVVVGYKVHIQGRTDTSIVRPPNLRVKKFPPNTDAWLRVKMHDLLNKVPDNILKEDLA
jgi:hypothetical protein